MSPPRRLDQRGSPPTGPRARFVVQRHRADRVHYDLRLEIDGVLVGWSVPDGPTLDPQAGRTAERVEDRPLDFVDFEGVIPAGLYGGGDVIVWDAGEWEPHGTDDPAGAVAAGELHAQVYGEKLQGRFVLHGSAQEWTLRHARDEHAVEGWDPGEHPYSVRSGRTNDEVAAESVRWWRSEPRTVRRAEAPSNDAFSALDALGDGGTWEVFGRRLTLTDLNEVAFPARGREKPVTKREFVRYAATIAPTALPYLRGRPLSVHRGAGCRHNGLPASAPHWVGRWDDPEARCTHTVINEPAALVWAANLGALEWHPWTSTIGDADLPTYALIVIEPGEHTTWAEVLHLARLHRTALNHLNVVGRAKVTGQRGIEIWIPIPAGPSFDDTRAWVGLLSRTVAATVPDLVGTNGLARLDSTQSALVAAYSPRAAAGAPVSAPIEWDELDDPSLRPDGWTIRTIADRVAARGDLFAPVLAPAKALPLWD